MLIIIFSKINISTVLVADERFFRLLCYENFKSVLFFLTSFVHFYLFFEIVHFPTTEKITLFFESATQLFEDFFQKFSLWVPFIVSLSEVIQAGIYRFSSTNCKICFKLSYFWSCYKVFSYFSRISHNIEKHHLCS